MLKGILICLFILVIAVLMVSRKLPTLLALPILAVGISLIAGVQVLGDEGIFKVVVQGGATRLADSAFSVIFGAWLGLILNKTGISETMVKKGAELGGDRTLVVTLILYFISAFLFTTLIGLGPVIMIGTIVIPILVSVGLDKLQAGIILLFAYASGNTYSLSTVNAYSSITGVDFETVMSFQLILVALAFVAGLAFIIVNYIRTGKKVSFSANINNDGFNNVTKSFEVKGVRGALAMITPLVPILLVLLLKMPLIPAFVAGILWAILMTLNCSFSEVINTLTKTFFDGFSSAGPTAGLMIMIGMLLAAVNMPEVSNALEPIIKLITPTSAIMFILFFGVLAPLCLYRGPLNLWGLGAGIATLMIGLNALPAPLLMGGFTSVGIMQISSCPTNTHNVWIAGYIGEDVLKITKKTLPFIWGSVIIGLIISVILYL